VSAQVMMVVVTNTGKGCPTQHKANLQQIHHHWHVFVAELDFDMDRSVFSQHLHRFSAW